MKIAFFVRCMSNGGAEKVAAQLTYCWSSLGHEVVVFTEFAPEEKEYDFKYVARETVNGEQRKSKDVLDALYEKYHFEIAVFNDGINADWFEKAFLSVRSLGVRTIIINHHTANNWMYGCQNTHELFMDEVLAQADVMVCVDKMWALWWNYRGVKAVYIANPVAQELNRERKKGALELVNTVEMAVEKLRKKKNIVWIGRLNDYLKRPELAIEILAKLLEVTADVQMTMLGACDAAVEKRLRSQLVVYSSDYNAQLKMPGFVNSDEYLKSADVHLFTSATEVTIPQVVLEASTAGVDTVAFDMPVLREGLDGYLNTDKAIADKWGAIMSGEQILCDYDDKTVLKVLLDELHQSQRWYAEKHLPELMMFRRFKMRVRPGYLLHRFMEKMIGIGKC